MVYLVERKENKRSEVKWESEEFMQRDLCAGTQRGDFSHCTAKTLS